MKSITALALALITAFALLPAAAAAEQDGRLGDSMPGMTRAPGADMMHGTQAESRVGAPAWERPQLSLALRNRDTLGLSEDQVNTLQGLVERFRQEAKQRVGEIGTVERELAGLLQRDPADLPQAENRMRAIEKLQADLRVARLRTIAEGRAVLSAEQRAKLDQLPAERERGAHGHGPQG